MKRESSLHITRAVSNDQVIKHPKEPINLAKSELARTIRNPKTVERITNAHQLEPGLSHGLFIKRKEVRMRFPYLLSVSSFNLPRQLEINEINKQIDK